MPQQKTRVLFINRSYWPDAEATGQLLTELCEDLASDFEVSVMCGQPVQNTQGVDFQRTGRQTRNGVEIIRLRHTRFNKASFVGRLSNMLTFYASTTWRCLFLTRHDIVVTETDPPFLCLAGRMLQCFRGSKHVCYLQDIYPDVAVALGKIRKGIVSRFLGWLFVRVYRKAQRVVVLSRDMQDLLLKKGLPSGQVEIIPNWIDTGLVRPIKQENPFRARHDCVNQFVAMYSGNLGMTQNLNLILDAAEQVKNDDRFRFFIIGGGARKPELEKAVIERGLSNVSVLNYQPKNQLGESLSAADVHIVFLDPKIRQCLMPSKIYGILAAGTPVVAFTEPESELAGMIRQHKLGTVLDQGCSGQLTRTILAMQKDRSECKAIGHRARSLALDLYDRKVVTRTWHHLLTAILNSRPSKK